MSLCASCGLEVTGNSGLCPHHHTICDDWAASNRAMCNFFHRGIVPTRLDKDKREDDPYTNTDVG